MPADMVRDAAPTLDVDANLARELTKVLGDPSAEDDEQAADAFADDAEKENGTGGAVFGNNTEAGCGCHFVLGFAILQQHFIFHYMPSMSSFRMHTSLHRICFRVAFSTCCAVTCLTSLLPAKMPDIAAT